VRAESSEDSSEGEFWGRAQSAYGMKDLTVESFNTLQRGREPQSLLSTATGSQAQGLWGGAAASAAPAPPPAAVGRRR
jgi:hypothetical protein